MGDEHAALTEIQKFRKHLLDPGSAKNHLVADACELFDLERNGLLRIYECTEPVRDLPVLHLHSPDLNDLVVHRAQTCSLQVKDYTGAVKTLPSGIFHHFLQIIHQITFHPVDNLKILILGNGVAGFCKCLHAAVVRDGQRRHSPFLRPLQKHRRIGHAVHIAHLRMAVELHSLFAGIIHAFCCKISGLPNARHGADGQLVIETVQRRQTLDLHKAPGRHPFLKLRQIVIFRKHLHVNRVRKIRQGQGDDGALPPDLPFLHVQDLSPDRDLAHLLYNLIQRNGLVFKIPAVEQLRIVASAKPETSAPFRRSAFAGQPSGPGMLPALLPGGSAFFRGSLLLLSGRLFYTLCLCRLRLLQILGEITDALSQLCLALLSCTVIPALHIFHIYLHPEPAPLVEYPVQNPYNIVHRFPVIDPVRNPDQHRSFIRKIHPGIFHNASFIWAVRFQFRQNTLLVDIPQLLRRILLRQKKFFKNMYLHPAVSEDLPADLSRQVKKLILGNQLFTRNIDPQHPLIRRCGHFRDHDLLKKCMQRRFQLQVPEYVKKRFFIHASSSPAPA